MNCLYCGQLIESDNPKAKYCSEAHSKSYRRQLQSGQEPAQSGQNSDEIATRTFDFVLTRTDSKFEESKPNYYKYGDTVHERKCNMCAKDYKTRLNLLRQCSPKCQLELLSGK